MILGVIDSFNDCAFGIKLSDTKQIDLVKELALAGLASWYESANLDAEGNEYFTKEDIESFFDCGYAEPSSELLDRYHIEHTIVDLEIIEGKYVCDDYVAY